MSNSNSQHTILVTGGCGYIGSHTVLALLDAGFQVVIFDKNLPNSAFGEYIKTLNNQCKFIEGNLLDLNLVQKTITQNNFDGVIHFAADPAFVSQSPQYISGYYTNNVISSINLINTCREHNLNNFVFSSTAAMYGNPKTLPIREDSELAPINVYGYTKSVIETMLLDYNRAYNFQSVRLRYFNACGADSDMRSGEEHDPEVHLIPNILQSVGTDKVFELFGNDYKTVDGTCMRDYIHVSDLASAHLKALKLMLNSNDNTCQVINLGTGAGFTNQQIFTTAEKTIGQSIPLKIVGRRAGDPDELVADNTKAKNILGWQPVNSSLDNILQSAWKWQQNKK